MDGHIEAAAILAMNWGYRPVSFVELQERLTPIVEWIHHHPQAERFYPVVPVPEFRP